MDSTFAYIPIDRRLAIAQGERLPDRTEGAALFADISGFTSLTETLANELGPKRGAEELTKQLDIVYGGLIAEVERYRGTVIGFAGDAITCWFDGDNGLKAVACAFAMQHVMSQFATVRTPAGTEVALAIKVSVAYGPVRRFQLGDPTIQYIDTIAGATLDRMAAAEHHADKGEVVVTADVVERIGDRLSIGRWTGIDHSEEPVAQVAEILSPVEADPWPDLPADALATEQIEPWILPGVYERLATGHGDYLAEIRPVVVLFLRFGGIDYDHDPEAGEKLNSYITWVQRILSGYEASLLQVTIGDKGSTFYSSFGAPIAHDDDPLRAVAAALELCSIPTELGYIDSVQIGISQGRIRVGPYGGPTRRTYGVLGDDVNLAARLMQRAEPGQILVSKRIAQAVSKRYDLDDLGAISVKGKNKPVLVSRVMGRKVEHVSDVLFAAPLVGRDLELEQMARIVDATLECKGQVLRVEGAAGIGKSHLVSALMKDASERGMRIATGACQSTSEGNAYAPWRQVIKVFLALTDDATSDADPADAVADQISTIEGYFSRTNSDWLLRLPLLGDLLGLPIPDNATTAGFDPRLRQSALFDLVADLVQTWADEQPLFLMIDDVHWMDEASKGLTLALARTITHAPVLITVVNRPAFTGQDTLPGLDQLPCYQRLNLDELSPAAVIALVENRLGGPAAALTRSLIVSSTQGNPFFTEELVDNLLESGRLYRDENGIWSLFDEMVSALRRADCLVWSDGQWVMGPNASFAGLDLGLPDSVEGVVLSRIDRLPEANKLTLRVASVIGRAFALAVLYHAHPLELTEEEISRQVELLGERDFTRVESPAPHEVHMFKHNITHDVAYETLLFAQRRQLHRAVGETLEQSHPDAVDQLAYHTFLGEDWERALRYQVLAGQQAQRLFANHEGIEHFRKALLCAENLPPEPTLTQRQSINVNLGTMLTYTGQYEPALEHLGTALQLAVEMGDTEAQAQACRWKAYLYEYRGEMETALEWLQRGLDALGDAETVATSELLAIGGLIGTRQGNYVTAQEQCERSIYIAENLSESTALAFACNSRAIVSILKGNSADAIEYFQRALDIYRRTENIHGEAMSSNGVANVYFSKSEWPEADTFYRRSREVFSQTGDVLHLAFANNNLGGIALNQGRLDEALAYYQESLESLEKIGGSLYVIGALHMNLGATYSRKLEIEAARKHLNISKDYFEQTNSRDFLPEMYRHLAETALRAGNAEEAEDYGQTALGLARELTMRAEEGVSLRVLGGVALSLELWDLAGTYLSQSITALTEVGDVYELARSRMALAEVLLSQGKPDEAATLLASCTDTFMQLEAVLDLSAARELRDKLDGYAVGPR